MLKFLRKYQKIMLAIFVVVLMIAFVAPQLFQQMGTKPDKIKVATLDGSPVTAGQIRIANAETRMLDSLSPLILPGILGLDQTHRGEHWLLLRHEAEAAGFVGDMEDGRSFVDDVAFQTARLALQQQFGQFADQALQMPQYQERIVQMAQEMAARVGAAGGPVGMTEQDGLRTLAAARGVMRMKEAYVTAARPSPALTVATARRYGDAATINYVMLPASLVAGEIPDPTAEELAAHFELYKNGEPGSGAYGIGYKQSQRIKLEWLVVDRAQLAGSITPDRVELRKLYDANRAKYTGEYEVERELVRGDYLSQRADELVEEIGRILRAEVLRTTRRLEQDGPYKKLPADWSAHRPRLEAVAQAIVENIERSKGVKIPLPRVEIRDAAWLDQAATAALPEIGGSTVRAGNTQAPFAAYAFQVRELGGLPALGLQVGLTEINAPATDARGNQYYFTVTDAREASAPESMDEVATLKDDWKSIRAYERLAAELPVYEQLGRTETLEAVARLVAGDGGTPVVPVVDVEVGRERVQAPDPELDQQSFRDAIMDAAEKLDPRLPPEQVSANPAATLGHALPLSRSVVVAKIKSLSPITVEQYRGLAVGVTVRATMFEVQEVATEDPSVVNPFNFEAMKTRLKYAEIAGTREEETKGPEKAAGTGPTGGEPGGTPAATPAAGSPAPASGS